jgi:hypothetical protein
MRHNVLISILAVTSMLNAPLYGVSFGTIHVKNLTNVEITLQYTSSCFLVGTYTGEPTLIYPGESTDRTHLGCTFYDIIVRKTNGEVIFRDTGPKEKVIGIVFNGPDGRLLALFQ